MSTATLTPGFSGTRPAVRRPAGRVAPQRAASRAAGVRLTRRGRLVLTTLFLGLVLAVLTAFGAHSAATSEPGAPVPTRVVQVQPGDTLWDIASEVAAPGEVRDMIHRIEELNALPGAELKVGQKISVPVA